MKRWTVGEITVTEIPEVPIPLGLLDGMMRGETAEAVKAVDWLAPDYANEAGQTLWDIHAYVVDTGSRVILVDPGCGNGKSFAGDHPMSDLDSPFLERLADGGYSPDDIDLIVCTHVHLDHIGWCTVKDEEGRWTPTFPRARVLVVDAEFAEHRAQMEDAAPEARALRDERTAIHVETFRPLLDAGLLQLVPADSEIVPGMRFASTPGHTRAHQSIWLESAGRTAFITGDFIHHPAQIAHPSWSSAVDSDPDTTAENRWTFLRTHAGTDLLILGTHFTGPAAGYLVEDGEGFRLSATRPS